MSVCPAKDVEQADFEQVIDVIHPRHKTTHVSPCNLHMSLLMVFTSSLPKHYMHLRHKLLCTIYLPERAYLDIKHGSGAGSIMPLKAQCHSTV